MKAKKDKEKKIDWLDEGFSDLSIPLSLMSKRDLIKAVLPVLERLAEDFVTFGQADAGDGYMDEFNIYPGEEFCEWLKERIKQ